MPLLRETLTGILAWSLYPKLTAIKTIFQIEETVVARTQITLSPDRKVKVTAYINTKGNAYIV